MKIEVGKTYETKAGARVRIIAVDRESELFPIIGLETVHRVDGGEEEIVKTYTCNGRYMAASPSGADLLCEVRPFDDLPMDTLVWVRNNEDNIWLARYFYKVIDGQPRAFDGGATSKTILNSPQRIENVSDGVVRAHTSGWVHITTTRPHGY